MIYQSMTFYVAETGFHVFLNWKQRSQFLSKQINNVLNNYLKGTIESGGR